MSPAIITCTEFELQGCDVAHQLDLAHTMPNTTQGIRGPMCLYVGTEKTLLASFMGKQGGNDW